MTPRDNEIIITSQDFWFKVIEMLQQNWALIDATADGGVVAWFVSDVSGVFDELRFPTREAAYQSLARNGFARLALDDHAQQFLGPPAPPYTRRHHPNGPIYSSGRFWRE